MAEDVNWKYRAILLFSPYFLSLPVGLQIALKLIDPASCLHPILWKCYVCSVELSRQSQYDEVSSNILKIKYIINI
jgi:hypothetical protein